MHRRSPWMLILSFIALLVAPKPWCAQTPNPAKPEPLPHHLKIGLALSGGGARGAAHIGVLRVLEDLHIPVDYVAGTSMGAIVGGLYASGMSPDAIEKALEGVDWDLVLTGKPPRKDLSLRRKEDEFHYPSSLEMGVKKTGITMPMGLISGQNFEQTLTKLTLNVCKVHDFSRLPIPFSCTATDIVTGESVVLKTGQLAMAIRASMSLPGVFPPVERDGHLLVDGGLMNNLPVDVARAMGADVVIAVNIGTPPARREDLKSLFGIAGQMVSLLQEGNIQSRAKLADVLIEPDLQGITMVEYEKMPEAIARGTTAAEALADKLKAYAVPAAAYPEEIARQRGQPPELLVIDEVHIECDNPLDERMAKKRLRVLTGEPLDVPALQEDLTRIWDAGDYDSVTFSVRDAQGKTQLVVNALPKSWGPNYLKFGLNLQADLSGHTYFNLMANFTKDRINALGAQWRTDLQVGRSNMFRTEFYQPLDPADHFFLSTWGELRNDLQDIYSGDDNVAVYDVRQALAGADLGLSLGKYGEIRVGPVWRHIRAFPDVGLPDLPKLTENASGAHARILIDRLDNAAFPTSGRYMDLNYFEGFRSMGSDVDYKKAELYASQFLTFGKSVVEARLTGGSSLGAEPPYFDKYSLGGFFTFSGYHEGQLRGNYYGVFRLGYSYRLANMPAGLGRGVYAGAFADVGNVWARATDISTTDLKYSGTLSFGVDTRFGPIYVGYGYAKDGNSSFYFSLGRSF